MCTLYYLVGKGPACRHVYRPAPAREHTFKLKKGPPRKSIGDSSGFYVNMSLFLWVMDDVTILTYHEQSGSIEVGRDSYQKPANFAKTHHNIPQTLFQLVRPLHSGASSP